MPIAHLMPIILNHARICISFYSNLRCEHCYVPEDYRNQYKRLIKAITTIYRGMTSIIDLLVDKYSLRRVSLTGGEPLVERVFPRSAAVMAHVNKRGLHIQLNRGGLGQMPIHGVVSFGDDREKVAFQVSFDAATLWTVSQAGRPFTTPHSGRWLREPIAGASCRSGWLLTGTASVKCSTLAGFYRLSASTPSWPGRCSPRGAFDNKDPLLGSVDEIRELQEAQWGLLRRLAQHRSNGRRRFSSIRRSRGQTLDIPSATAVPPRSTSLQTAICISFPSSLGIPIAARSCSAISDRRKQPGEASAYCTGSQEAPASSGCPRWPSQAALLEKIKSRALACA